MITFRFYLVTLVAIFLAVALGVVIGSTFLEPALVQDLNNQVESVRNSLDERVARIDDLNAEIDDLQEFVEGSAAFAVDGRLRGASVLVAADDGVESEAVERLVSRLRQAGASAEGIVWLQPSMGSAEEAAAVVEALGVTVDLEDEVAVQAAVWAAVVRHANEAVAGGATEGGPPTTLGPEGTTTTTVEGPAGTSDAASPTTATTATTEVADTTGAPTTTVPDTTGPPDTAAAPAPRLFAAEPLQVLADAGWVRLQEIEPAEGTPPPAPADGQSVPPLAVVLVGGSEAEPEAPAVVSLARPLASAGVPTVVADVWVEGDEDEEPPRPSRGVALRAIREDAELAARVATVDHLDTIQGQVAVALAVRDLGADIVGHYGYGDGADLVVPPWQGP